MPDVEIVSLRVTGNRIGRALAARGMSQETCARRAGISTRTMHRAIRGPRPPLLEIALRLAAVLETPVAELFIVQTRTRRIVPR